MAEPAPGRFWNHEKRTRRLGPLHRKLCKAGSSDVTVFHEVTRARRPGPQSVEATCNDTRRPAMSDEYFDDDARRNRDPGLDLGKFKSVACRYDPASGAHAFETIAAMATVHDLLVDAALAMLVIRACGVCGWISDLAESLSVEVRVANVLGEAWKWRRVSARPTATTLKLKLAAGGVAPDRARAAAGRAPAPLADPPPPRGNRPADGDQEHDPQPAGRCRGCRCRAGRARWTGVARRTEAAGPPAGGVQGRRPVARAARPRAARRARWRR